MPLLNPQLICFDSACTLHGSFREGEASEEQDPSGTGTVGQSLEMPGDGYAWRKYGQKFILKIRKNSYFKCREEGCKAKKRVEWPPSDPSNVKVTYDGVHHHPSPQLLSASYREERAGMANRYNLVIQVLGPPGDSS
ncbi:probable WRKY transcription factor 51 isoform X2 [Musa acuminata AAA Group]|uniref:probable WRKY transcription factor 51 isoform X2 n=1 Tax=Musa acuminata AAA Group TaxID=214697 RepID=UPI0031E2FE84